MVDTRDPVASAIAAYVMPVDCNAATFSDQDFVSTPHPTIFRNPLQRHFVTQFRPDSVMESIDESIGARIRSTREEQGIKRGDLAKTMGLAYTTLADLERGKAKSTTKLHKAAERLRVNIEWLETGRGPKYAEPTPDHQSRSMRLDPSMIAVTHRVLRELYASDLGVPFCIEEDACAARFVQVYALRAGLSARPTPEEWVEYGRKLEVIMKPQGALDGRGDGVPTEGTGTKNVAGRIRRPKA